MTLPTIHLNGTSGESLQKAYQEAEHAVHDAIELLAKTGPNGRDYYPQGQAAIDSAITEHTSRMARLAGVKEELQTLIYHCHDNTAKRQP